MIQLKNKMLMTRVKPMIRKSRVSKGKPYTKEELIQRGTKKGLDSKN